MVGDPIADEMEAIALVGQMDGELEDRPMQARQPHQPHSDPS
jgi:hypothetical protein